MSAERVGELAHPAVTFTERDSIGSAIEELSAGWPAIVVIEGVSNLVLPWEAVGYSENRRLVDLPIEAAVVIKPSVHVRDALRALGDARFCVTRLPEGGLGVVARRLILEAVVAHSEDGFGGIVDQLPEGVVVIGEDGKIEYLNRAAERLLAFLGPCRIGERLPGFGGVPLSTFVGDAAAGLPRDIVVADPVPRIFSVRTLHTVDAPHAKTVLVLRDVTHVRHRQARETTQERLVLLGQLAGGIVHDFNNLLTVIMVTASLSAQTAPPGPQSDAEVILNSATKASHLVRSLLGFSRQELVQPILLDLREMLEDLAWLMQRLVGDRIELKLTVAADLWPVSADPVQLERVLANLVVNARNAMPNGGHVTIEAKNVAGPDAGAKGSVSIVVRDTGHGMDPETMSHVFERYFTTGGEAGFGLGLATVRAVIGELGGTVDVESTVNVGTSFEIVLPAAEGVPSRSDAKRECAALPVGSGRVLVVEDDADVGPTLRQVLERAGYATRLLTSGDEAATAIDVEGPPDLLIVDAVLQGKSGLDLATRVRARFPRLRVLVMSGYAEADLPQVTSDPLIDFIAKPFAGRAFLDRVGAAVGVGDE